MIKKGWRERREIKRDGWDRGERENRKEKKRDEKRERKEGRGGGEKGVLREEE